MRIPIEIKKVKEIKKVNKMNKVNKVKKVAVALARHTGQDEGEACHHAWSRLGILLQRGNSAILANRVPTHPGAPIDGQL